MTDEAKQDIAEDTMRDDALTAIKDQRISFLEAQVADLKDKLEAERGRNRVLGFQIRTLLDAGKRY